MSEYRKPPPSFGFANPSNKGLFDLGMIVETPRAAVALQVADRPMTTLFLPEEY